MRVFFAVVASMLSVPWFAAGDSTPATLSAFAARKADRILREQLPCLGCHVLRGEGGRIGTDLSDVGARRGLAYIESMIDDPQRTVPGTPMPKTPMDARARSLVARYLSTLGRRPGAPPPASQVAPPPPSPGAPAGTATPAANGAQLYARWCATCHGSSGRGDGPNARYLPKRPAPHADANVIGTRADDSLYDVIAAGGTILQAGSRMPAFGATLTQGEIRALVRHIRRLCACEAPAWSRDGAKRP